MQKTLPKNVNTNSDSPILYERYLRGDNQWAMGGSVNLSLNGGNRSADTSTKNRGGNDETVTFSYTIKGTNIKGSQSLRILKSHPDENIIKWSDEFREAAASCAWDEQTQVAVLREIVRNEAGDLIKTKYTSETILKALGEYVYPIHKRAYYLKKLQEMQQINFELIVEYHSKITETVKALAICSEMNVSQQQIKVEETFITNLSTLTQIKMNELKISQVSDMIKAIQSVENAIRERCSVNVEKDANTISPATPKYCTKHKSATHSREECLAQKKARDKSKKETKGQLNAKTVGLNLSKEFTVKASINGQELSLLVDTGSCLNIISKKFVDKTFATKELSKHLEVTLADGSKN